ncbi:ImmA/IrrE family metallo-endopeptidase [Herbaspirillum rubrisubalbicans]|uniref:ImmA/IrrE family metallo-endopeptidase n=1 Tax=Herbaspirillum rubrisubalbicans TaxID=80842 RepID=A0AAD0XHS0_9BURK|nr:ImmA/IrrE family metallo-endopeptidase [Herbaspirillum rubrisubalbicans]AYR25792.1 ImmA/IrrE family metallo-endopeptidase [Herbaspirillum rubrisubalbicans]
MNAEINTVQEHSKFPNADALLDYLESRKDFDVAAPIDLMAIAKILGVEIDESISMDDMSSVGKISLSEGGRAKIWINPLENSYGPRKRFTLAHELGHYCLHLSESRQSFVDTKTTMNRTESYWDVHEYEANTFAAELLMPKRLIISEGNKIIQSYKQEHNSEGVPKVQFIDSLARKLGASTKAMEYRLMNLGIIPKN